MRISTRSRYGIRLMIEIAEKFGKGNVLLKEVAESQDISEKYLSQIVIPLRRAGLIIGSRGIHGGYTLAKPPGEITVKEVIEVLEGDLAVIDCITNSRLCEKSGKCASIELWNMLSKNITDFLNSLTLNDLLKIKREKELKYIDYSI